MDTKRLISINFKLSSFNRNSLLAWIFIGIFSLFASNIWQFYQQHYQKWSSETHKVEAMIVDQENYSGVNDSGYGEIRTRLFFEFKVDSETYKGATTLIKDSVQGLQTLLIEYDKANPLRFRSLVGEPENDSNVFYLLAFPILALLLFLRSLWKNFRMGQVLQNSGIAKLQVRNVRERPHQRDVESGSTDSEKSFSVEYTLENGEVFRTSFKRRGSLRSDGEEQIFYHRDKPGRVVFFRDLPKGFYLGDEGEVQIKLWAFLWYNSLPLIILIAAKWYSAQGF